MNEDNRRKLWVLIQEALYLDKFKLTLVIKKLTLVIKNGGKNG